MSKHYSMFFVEEEGTASSFQGIAEAIEARRSPALVNRNPFLRPPMSAAKPRRSPCATDGPTRYHLAAFEEFAVEPNPHGFVPFIGPGLADKHRRPRRGCRGESSVRPSFTFSAPVSKGSRCQPRPTSPSGAGARYKTGLRNTAPPAPLRPHRQAL